MSRKLAEEIAKRLRAARKAAGFKSAKDFAVTQLIPLSTYSQHETGKRSINAELILAYSNKLQVSPYWLLTGDGEPYSKECDLKKKPYIENEIYSISNQNINTVSKFVLVDVELLKKILFLLEPLLIDETIKLSYTELINYCFDVYNIVSTLSVDTTEKEKVIGLTISSLKRGYVQDKQQLKVFTK